MLSRTAHNLYWIGRYMERAEFTTRLIEATIRLSSLSGDSQADRAWRSALALMLIDLRGRLILVNSAFGLEYPRPLPPLIRMVGPMLPEVEALPAEMDSCAARSCAISAWRPSS